MYQRGRCSSLLEIIISRSNQFEAGRPGITPMPPNRTKASQTAESSTRAKGKNKRRIHAKQKGEASLGVSKLKSTLRQTRRLLAKV
jgi:hypothetical protein